MSKNCFPPYLLNQSTYGKIDGTPEEPSDRRSNYGGKSKFEGVTCKCLQDKLEETLSLHELGLPLGTEPWNAKLGKLHENMGKFSTFSVTSKPNRPGGTRNN